MTSTIRDLRNSNDVLDAITECIPDDVIIDLDDDITVYLEVFDVEAETLDEDVGTLIVEFAAKDYGDYDNFRHPRYDCLHMNEVRWGVGPATLVVRWTAHVEEE